MATVTAAVNRYTNALVHRFGLMANGDVGVPILSQNALRSMQVSGTFGVLGTVVLEGSNDDGANWAPLTDVNGAALSFTSAGAKMFNAPMGKIRPRVTGGDGTTSLTVLISE